MEERMSLSLLFYLARNLIQLKLENQTKQCTKRIILTDDCSFIPAAN